MKNQLTARGSRTNDDLYHLDGLDFSALGDFSKLGDHAAVQIGGSPSITMARAVADDFADTVRDTTAPFGRLTPGSSVTGNVEVRGDHDIFAISLTAGQRVTLNLNTAATSGLSDPLLSVRNAAGSVLATNDDFGGSRNSQITLTAQTAGTYYLDAGGYGSSVGRYSLSASGTAPPPVPTDDYRDNITDTTAPFGALAIGAASTGRVETAGDKDLFSFAATAGTTYTFNLNNASSGGLGDPVLRLLNTSGGQIAINDDFGSGQNSQITYTASSTGTVYLEAAGYQSGTGGYSLTAAGSTPPTSGGGFDIVIRYTGDPQYQALFDQAAARWESVITGDIPNFNSSRYGLIDDLLIDASISAIDGQGSVLGQAGPDEFRSGSLLPSHGVMQFDSADIASLAGGGSLLGVILHEMGHVLGIGTLWDSLGLESNFRYTGANALAEYRTLSGNPNATFVPVENDGGPGTAGGHWEESVFNGELMTGFANGSLAMSRMTIASLKDVGYQVDLSQADPYVLGAALQGPQSLAMPDQVLGLI
ncbi:pre-peptidase C-terminal domain-containing protein [Sphingomonas sp. SUN019]|uniref:pre-peptidase C-terminal domain-containing protein n=1 Tax=Sphingomonas sp. SUN019 TaxID=2937788 RepID=UPI002164E7AC|nr:pre-peptidase C-terminal domain-containing protein [Sphingomonas sp. SUN019]UVO51893.1 pre-peptidase C-terminal domain-containing protein [Sphingomonas sp. SUN019]